MVLVMVLNGSTPSPLQYNGMHHANRSEWRLIIYTCSDLSFAKCAVLGKYSKLAAFEVYNMEIKVHLFL